MSLLKQVGEKDKADGNRAEFKEIFARLSARLSEMELRITKRLDSHFKWLVVILFFLLGLAVTIIKL